MNTIRKNIATILPIYFSAGVIFSFSQNRIISKRILYTGLHAKVGYFLFFIFVFIMYYMIELRKYQTKVNYFHSLTFISLLLTIATSIFYKYNFPTHLFSMVCLIIVVCFSCVLHYRFFSRAEIIEHKDEK